MPGGVEIIGAAAFETCWDLASVTLPDSLKTIEESAFANDICLADIDLPDGLTGIGKMAFYYCSSLESMALPGSGVSAWGGIRSDGAWYYVYDLHRAGELLQTFFLGEDACAVMEPNKKP